MAANHDSDAYSRLMSGIHPHYIYQYDAYARALPAYEEPIAEPAPAPKDPRRRPAPEAAPKAAPVARPRRKLLPRFEYYFGHVRKTALMTYALVAVLAACGLGVLFVQSYLAQGALDSRKLHAAVEEKRADNYAMQLKLYNVYDKDELIRLATELGMAKPAEHQLIRIPASRLDYATQFDDANPSRTIKETLGDYLNLIKKPTSAAGN